MIGRERNLAGISLKTLLSVLILFFWILFPESMMGGGHTFWISIYNELAGNEVQGHKISKTEKSNVEPPME